MRIPSVKVGKNWENLVVRDDVLHIHNLSPLKTLGEEIFNTNINQVKKYTDALYEWFNWEVASGNKKNLRITKEYLDSAVIRNK
eukprot:snap_masked-scaffold_5-processed-gene-15.32-mRNA-1 protein AED:1.00 eAED:1.00 QI:0/-1/0/0/-1/1/1/0/83